nr:hypothetical protein [Tanacetum cinerariifolium]
AVSSCQSGNEGPVAADLNSATPAVAEQAGKVQELITQIDRQKAVIETEKNKLTALQQQLEGARQNLEGLKKEGLKPKLPECRAAGPHAVDSSVGRYAEAVGLAHYRHARGQRGQAQVKPLGGVKLGPERAGNVAGRQKAGDGGSR